MRVIARYSLFALLAVMCTSCGHHAPQPQPATAPPLQTGKGTLTPPAPVQPETTDHPLASPLPPPSAQTVPLPPPPPPKKVRKKSKPVAKPAETQTAAATPAPSQQPAAEHTGTSSPIGELTTGDVALGEKTKHETSDLINETQKGLNGINRSLSADEKITASQIHTFLKQAQVALENGDTDGALTLATKAKLLLDELTKP
jgi:outer membrane biosynthesis protein TonB